MKTSISWLLLLYAFIEAQLSRSLFYTISDLEKQLQDNINFFFPDKNTTKEEKIKLLSKILDTSFSLPLNISEEAAKTVLEEARNRLITFKSAYFDREKSVVYDRIAVASGQKGIAIWKPIWDYIISQGEDIYRFEGKHFVSIPERLDIHVKTRRLVKNHLCTTAGKPQKFRLLTAKKKILKTLFPNGELVMSNLAGYYYAAGKPVMLARVNPFFDEEVGVLYHKKLVDSNLNPIYLQFGKAIEVFERQIHGSDRCKKIVRKSEKTNPLIYFEEGEVVILPYEEVQNNEIMTHLMESIDIKSLNGLNIINEYVRKKLQLDIEFIQSA